MVQRKKKKSAKAEVQEAESLEEPVVQKPRQKKDIIALPADFDINALHIFKRPVWKHYLRHFWVLVVITLNVAMMGSFFNRLNTHHLMHPFREIFFFVFVAAIDIFMAAPMILEANIVETENESITLHLLYWKVRIPWKEIKEFSQPGLIKFTILFTQHCRYFLNKYDLKDFSQLAQIIIAKTQKP